ncbi:hypothetical protein HG535_0G03920 [Zygotorulaspora mrakii]|uniref:Acyl-protein thioesterase 1 n=1 Tax=Zygotorulaspora mrakii TaxID=42260 RepID=A0A7H9B937_ZYGMR|nr:uncharacterized protein HG535_0G03920 [Zygotorulaspora mrakii]QLG74509.1 hypothetical protein HG535_0G03920 [Zygotorulaspora mrakii]
MSAVRIAAKVLPANTGIVILHGLGDTANGFPRTIANYLRGIPAFEQTSFILPDAPISPVSLNNGYKMPSWFDIYELSAHPSRVDADGFMKSLGVIEKCVQEHIDAGIKPENIVVCGFSQGAALSLSSAATLPVKIGAFAAFSGFVTIPNQLRQIKKDHNLDTPIFHGHGDSDPVVPLEGGFIAKDFYQNDCGFKNIQFEVYKGMDHSVCPEEMDQFVKFLKRALKMK